METSGKNVNTDSTKSTADGLYNRHKKDGDAVILNLHNSNSISANFKGENIYRLL